MKLFDLLFEYRSYDEMVNRLRSVYSLVLRGATEGEKTAAQSAYNRTLDAIRRDYGEEQATRADKIVKSTAQSSSNSSYTKTKQEPPKEPPRQKTYKSSTGNTNKNYGGKNAYYADPRTGWSFYVLHFVDPDAGKRGSNKIWGYASKNGKFVSFWGAYGKSIRTKELYSDREAVLQVAKKAAKGYKKVDLSVNPAEYAYIFNQFT